MRRTFPQAPTLPAAAPASTSTSHQTNDRREAFKVLDDMFSGESESDSDSQSVKYFQWMFNFTFKVKSKSWCSNLNIRSCVTCSSRDLIWISVKINTASLPILVVCFKFILTFLERYISIYSLQRGQDWKYFNFLPSFFRQSVIFSFFC